MWQCNAISRPSASSLAHKRSLMWCHVCTCVDMKVGFLAPIRSSRTITSMRSRSVPVTLLYKDRQSMKSSDVFSHKNTKGGSWSSSHKLFSQVFHNFEFSQDSVIFVSSKWKFFSMKQDKRQSWGEGGVISGIFGFLIDYLMSDWWHIKDVTGRASINEDIMLSR